MDNILNKNQDLHEYCHGIIVHGSTIDSTGESHIPVRRSLARNVVTCNVTEPTVTGIPLNCVHLLPYIA